MLVRLYTDVKITYTYTCTIVYVYAAVRDYLYVGYLWSVTDLMEKHGIAWRARTHGDGRPGADEEGGKSLVRFSRVFG